jgi:hypothetical protein
LRGIQKVQKSHEKREDGPEPGRVILSVDKVIGHVRKEDSSDSIAWADPPHNVHILPHAKSASYRVT